MSAVEWTRCSGAWSRSCPGAPQAIESKTQRSGALAVSIVNTEDDIEDTTAELSDTQVCLFIAISGEGCHPP